MRRVLLFTLVSLAGLGLLAVVRPGRDSLPGLQPFPSKLRAEIHAVRDGAATVRELSVNPNIDEGFISHEELHALLTGSVEDLGPEYQAALQARSEAMRLMHLIGKGDDLASLVRDPDSSSGIAGVYFPARKSLVVVGEVQTIGLLQEFILAHEYIHSFQDKSFDLVHVIVPGKTPFSEESTLGQCIAEGDATVGAQAYMDKVKGAGWELKAAAEAQAALSAAIPQVGSATSASEAAERLGFARYVLFLYGDCPKFVSDVRDRFGWEGVNELYSKPPATSEQVLHIEKFISQERPLTVTTTDLGPSLGVGWQEQSSESFGELDLLAYLFGLSRNDASARLGADGWGGGMLELYANNDTPGGDALAHLTLLWDSRADLLQFRTEYQRSLMRLGGTTSQIGLLAPIWRWQASYRDMGYVRWNMDSARVDILLSTSESALDAAARALPSVDSE
jgi:hypothetical protein